MVTDQNLHLRMQALMGIQEDIQNKNSYRPHVRSEAGYDITQTTVVIKTNVLKGANVKLPTRLIKFLFGDFTQV